jgi:hypothetical protein
MSPASPIIHNIESLLKARYSDFSRDENEKILDGIQNFAVRAQMNVALHRLLQDAARTIHSLFGFQEVAIGLRNPDDGKYRYDTVTGYKKESEDALRHCEYTYDQFVNQREFPSVRITKMLDMNLGDVSPATDKEKECWNRPIQLAVKRSSPDEFIEADYLDVMMYASGSDLLGWIEVSAPRDGKMPSGHTLRGLELFSSVLSLAVQCQLKR